MTAHAALLERLEAAAKELSESVYAEMVEDPFWLARYAERATTHMKQDSVFHLRYLREALASEHAGVIESYARWLQQLLCARGMCTEHIAENFERLARAIAAYGWPDAAPAGELLAAASAALAYPPGPAADLQRAQRAIAGADRDAVHLVSFLADAIGQDAPARFTAHVAWLGGFDESRGIPRDRLRSRLAALGTGIAEHAPAARACAAELLAAAATAL